MPNPEESFTKIGVPEDGSCLFWAVTLAYLTPVKNDDALFRQRYETLFGNEETATQNLNHNRNLVQNYNTYDNTFVGLVRNTFRNRVADHIRSNENELRAFVEGESGRSFDDYLQNMRNPNTWGGEPEIRAMSEMLGADISVSGASNTRYANGDVQIQLFHVGTLGVRNHYNFGLEQHIVNDNEVGRLQNSLKESIKHYQGGPQDFELIQLLIQETDSSKASTSTQQRKDFESFQARFQSYIDQIPSYLHSVKKPGFFSHFFFGSFSVLLDTEIAEKLNIKKIYFSFANSKTLKVVVIKNGQIGNGEDAINNINLFSISEGELGHQFTPDELEKILRENIDKSKIKDQDVENKIQNIKNEIQGEIESRLVQIFKEKDGIFVNMEVKKILDSAAGQEFHEIKKGLWNNPEGDIAGLTGSDKTIVERSLERILGEVSKVHSKYEKSLQYGSKAREAAHHGFVAGALNNFRYRHNLRVYLEQFAERGYADIVLLPRGPNRALDSIPIIIELKAGKGPNLTPDKALEQAEKYAQGFQPNVQRVLTTSDDILCVGVNLDYPSPISNIKAPSRKTKIVPFLQDMLESTDEWNKNDIDKRILKTRILDNMERIYHTFPGTGEKGDNHYFSRFLLGQSLLLNEVLGIGFEKHIFIYKENISTETHPKPSKPQRPVAQKAKDELSKGLDKSHAIVSMVLIPESTEKLVYVINIVEANRKDVLEKVLPLDRLNQKIGDREIVELDLNFDTRYKSNFQKYLTVKASDPVSLEQYSHRVIDEFQGTFREVPYPDQLKETFDRALDSQLTSAQSSSINEYNELFKKIGEGIWSFKALINNEPHLQGVLNGVSSYYSDLKLQESPEARALVLTEFQTGRGERIDMLVHGIKFEGDDKNAKEYTPIGLELKASRQGKGAQALLKEANDQINKEYKKGVTYKTLTDGDEVKFIGVVFDKGAKKADSLILTSEKSIPVKVVHSSTLVLPTVGQCSKEREKRNIDMACVDSRDEEDITKEEKERRIKELLSDQMMMKIKLKKLESEISDEVLSRHEEIESVATYDVNKSDVLSNALQSLKLSKMLLLMSQKSEVSTELQEKAYYNALTDLGALIHDHKNHVHGDHLSALESRVHGNQLFSVAHDLYYLSKSEGNVDQDKLYSDQVKSKISSYVEGENGLDDIYSEFNIIDIKGYFSDSDIKDFYAEAEAYDKEVITIHSTQVFADGVEVYVEVKDSNGDYQKVVIGDVASIQNTENYILDEETSEIKLRIDDDKEYTTTQELEEGHVKHYLSIPGGYKVKVGNIISSFAENIKKAIHSKLHSLELSASKKDVEEISNAEITDRNYDNVVGEIKQNLLQKGVSEGTFNQLKDHLDSLGKKVFAEYISDVEKKLEGHEIEFDRSKFALAKANMSKGGKFFFLMAIYDLFDSINDVPTLGRHDNDALKKIFGINGILDAMDDVRESLSASYIRSDGKAVTKIPRDSAIGKVISKIPDSTRKTFVKIINNPVVQSITFATIAYQFGYSINEIVKGNHHPLNYYWTASSGIKLASMSIKPISVGVSSAMKGISSATKILRGLSTASKVLGKVAVVTMVADVFITIGVEIHERMEYTKAIAEQVPLLPGNEQAVVFFNWKDAGQRYEGIIRVKGYLNYIKDRAVHLLSAYNIAAVVQHVANIKEGYFITFDINTRNWEKRYLNISFDSIGMNFGTWVNLSSLDISKTLPMTLHALVMDEGWERFKCEFAFSARLECHRKINEKVVYIVNTDAKHVPHLTKCEYENLGLRIVSAPLECQVRKPQCDPQSAAAKDSAISKARRFMVNYNNEAYTDCTNTFTLSSEPFIFTKTTIGSSSPILYLLGPNRLTAAKNYPAVMVVPEGGVDYRGSTDHDNVFIINYDTYGHLIGGTKSNNTVVMNYNASTISVALHQYGTIRVEDSVIGLLNIPNYISHSTANQNITTGCKTRRVDAGEGGGNNSIQHYDVHCQDEDYEIRKVNKKDTHFRSAKQTTFIVDKNSGNGASIISSNNLESKKNLDTILIKNIDIAQLKINEHQADYSLELLTDDKRSTVTSTKIDSFENLVIQVEHYGIRKTITVQDKSLFDIIKDMEYQKLNHSGTGVSNKIIENSKKRSKAVILTDITVSEGLTAYGVAKDIINNNNLDIPISLVQVKKITGDVAHEAVVESMYSGEIVADFSHENIGCKKIITIEAGSHESKCVVKFPQAYKCDYPVDFTLRVTNNPTPYANNAYDKMVDLTGCDINPEDVEYRADDGCAAGIILSSRVNQGSFQIVLDNYLRGPKYQHVAFQFNKGGEFYKVNSVSLKLEPVLYNYEKKAEVDYDYFRYYDPDKQGLRIYRNQLDNENKIGFIDLRDKSILDSNVEIIDDSLLLLHKNNTLAKVENWNTYQHARKMIFAFNNTIVSNAKCVISACDSEDIVEEFMFIKEIKKLMNKKGGYGYTLLHYAVQEGNLNLVTFLLDSGADANAQDESSYGKKPIHIAAENNDKDIIDLLIKKGARVNDTDKNCWTPLHYAASGGQLEAARFLVDRGADINAVEASTDGKKPIHVAAMEGHENVIEFFISKGINVNDVATGNGRTPLHYAAWQGKLDAVKTLVDKSASIGARDKDDCTPLHYAALGGQLEAARFLVDKGADINAVCHADRGKPIHIAAMEGHENVIEFFISKGINVNDVATGNGRTPLHYAAWQGKLDAVKTLVDKSASIGARDKDDCTPLHYAALGGQLEAARFLVDKGADINAICHIDCRKPIHVAAMKGHKNVIEFFLSKGMSVNGVATENGWTPLHYAAWQGHLEAARFLVDRGADINAVETSAEGKKPIHVAAEGNNKNIIEFLLSKGVSVNDTDKEGWTPLHWAAWNDCLEAARLLVDRGADINAESSGGTTPLEMAETWSGSEIVNFLKAKKQSEYDYRLLAAVKSGNVSEVTDLLNRGANIEAKDEEGWTPLHWAAWIGHLEIASFLVDRRANISAADTSFNGGKPIHVAARGNNKNIIEFLLSKGVSVNDTDKEGWTPLHWAAWSSSLEAASFLVDRGANINAESIRGTTPLGMVETWGGQEIADFLRGKQNEYNLLLFDAAKNGDFDKVKDLTARGADVKAKDNNGKTPQDVAADKEHSNIVKYLEEKLNEERGKPVHRKRRHHHGDHPRHYNRSSRKLPATDLSNQPEVAASSGARPSSWINDLFSWAREKGSLLVSGIVNSVWPASVAKLSKETSYGSTTKNNLEPIDYSQIDMNGTILLIDTFIRKITGQKYVSSNTRSIPEQEVLGYVLSITEGFEKVVEQAAKDSKISIYRLGIDFMGMHKEITGKIMGGKFDEVSGILNSYVEKACPDREAGCPGKLSSKKFDKFMNALNNRLDLVLNQSMKQILSRNSRLEASDVKEQQISLEPKSYLNNTSVQSYLTQARDSRLR